MENKATITVSYDLDEDSFKVTTNILDNETVTAMLAMALASIEDKNSVVNKQQLN